MPTVVWVWGNVFNAFEDLFTPPRHSGGGGPVRRLQEGVDAQSTESVSARVGEAFAELNGHADDFFGFRMLEEAEAAGGKLPAKEVPGLNEIEGGLPWSQRILRAFQQAASAQADVTGAANAGSIVTGAAARKLDYGNGFFWGGHHHHDGLPEIFAGLSCLLPYDDSELPPWEVTQEAYYEGIDTFYVPEWCALARWQPHVSAGGVRTGGDGA
jgi:hypothetical protein